MNPSPFAGLHRLRLKFGRLRGRHMVGNRPTFALGAGLDFREFRRYAPGDDLRYLDWNAYGRLNQLYVKQFEALGELTLNLVIDRTPSMDFGGTHNKWRFARDVAKALGYVALNSLDKLRVLTVPWPAEQPVFGFQSRAQIPTMLERIDALTPLSLEAHGRALREALNESQHRNLVIVLSDVQETDSWFGFLTHLRRHVAAVVLLHLVAPNELNPALLDGEARLHDVELPASRTARVEITPAMLRAYTIELERHLGLVQAFCNESGLGYVRLNTSWPLDGRLWNRLRVQGIWE